MTNDVLIYLDQLIGQRQHHVRQALRRQLPAEPAEVTARHNRSRQSGLPPENALPQR